MLSEAMPKLMASALFAEIATKCLLIACVFCAEFMSHCFAECALVMVSWVVKVFDEIIKRVVSGARFEIVSMRLAWSILETKWTD